MGSFCSGSQNTTTRQQQTQDTNQNAQNAVTGTSGGTTTPYLQWLSSEAANMGSPFGTMGNPWIAASASPVTAGNIESLAYPLAGQEFQTAYGAMLPSIQDQTKAIMEASSANPDASSLPGALGRYYGTVNANLANLAQGLTAGAYNAGIPVAETNQAALARAGMGINQGNLGWLGTVPGLVSTAGNTFANQFGQQGTSEATGHTSGSGVSTGTTQWTPSYMSMLGSLFSMPSIFGGGGGGGGGAGAAGAGSFGGDVMSGIGQGLSWLGGLFAADGGAMRGDGYALGGGVDEDEDDRTARFADEVRKHFHAFHALRKHAEDGGRERHAEGDSVDGDVPATGSEGWSPEVSGSGAPGSVQAQDAADDAAQDAADEKRANADQAAAGVSKAFKDTGTKPLGPIAPPPKLYDAPHDNAAANALAHVFATAPRNVMGVPRYQSGGDTGSEVISTGQPSLGLGNPDVLSAENTLKAVDDSDRAAPGRDLTKTPAYKLALLDAARAWHPSGSTPLTAAHGGRVGFQGGAAVTPDTADTSGAFMPDLTAADPTPTSVSPAGMNFISDREGFSNKAYWDHNGNHWSVGFGTPASGPDDYVGSREEGQERLRRTMEPVSKWITSNITYPLSQPQHDALASFGMNVGLPNLAKLKDDINQGKDISGRMLSFNHLHDTHEPSRGLTARRGLEASMFKTGQYPSADDVARAGASPTGSGGEGYAPTPDNRNFLQRLGDSIKGAGTGYSNPQDPNYVKSGQAANDMLRSYGRDPMREWFAAFGENSGIPGVPGMTHGQLANLQNRSDFLLKQQEAAGNLFDPTGGYAPTLEAQKAAGTVTINGVPHDTLYSVPGQQVLRSYDYAQQKDLELQKSLYTQMNEIEQYVALGVMSREKAEELKSRIMGNYYQMKSGIHATPGTPTAAPGVRTPAPSADAAADLDQARRVIAQYPHRRDEVIKRVRAKYGDAAANGL